MKKIGIIGAGNMGEALIKALKAQGRNLKVTEKNTKRRNYIQKKYHVSLAKDNIKLAEASDIIILAVKPRDMKGTLTKLRPTLAGSDKLIISIAAGIKTKYIEKICGRVRVVRAMPNTPLVVGEGMTVISKGRYAKKKDLNTARDIFGTGGEVLELKEDLMDAATALSGSGPAYISFVIKSLVEAGMKMGLKKDIALELVTQTCSGTALLLKQVKCPPEDLIKKVASKGGTTEAALRVFKEKNLSRIIASAVKAAARRSRELNRGD